MVYQNWRIVTHFWIRKHPPKLDGLGKIVKMDYSYFPGAPKYNQGSRLGTLKWIFGLTERGRLDCILKQVPPSRTRKTLLPIINQHCLEGSLFCSDGWRAYHELAEHLDSEDVLHYPVNHSENYVYPETGAHTQTI